MPYIDGEAGFKATGTSQDAAEAVKPKAAQMRQAVLDYLKASGGHLTADEVADGMGLSPLQVRPRLTELLHLYRVEDTGARRPSALGRPSVVWAVVT